MFHQFFKYIILLSFVVVYYFYASRETLLAIFTVIFSSSIFILIDRTRFPAWIILIMGCMWTYLVDPKKSQWVNVFDFIFHSSDEFYSALTFWYLVVATSMIFGSCLYILVIALLKN